MTRAAVADTEHDQAEARAMLDQLRRDGPAIRLRDLVLVTGFSKMKFLGDIDRGRLHARRVEQGRNHVVLIDRAEARRYLEAIGFVERPRIVFRVQPSADPSGPS